MFNLFLEQPVVSMVRCFVALNLPQEVKEELCYVQEDLPAFSGKLTEKENLHLTLKFLDEVDEKKIGEIKSRLLKVSFKPFKASLGEVGVFSKDLIRIVWIHLLSVEELQKAIDAALFPAWHREDRFMSHLTIARVKFVENKALFLEELNKISPKKLSFQVNSFALMKSTLTKKWPIYEEIAKFQGK